MARYNAKRVKFANCNGVHIEVRAHWARSEPEQDAYFILTIQDVYDEWSEPDDWEYDNEAEAVAAFEEFVAEYGNKPNWNAQAAYDAAHGTINGEDPGIVAMREAYGEF